MTKVEKGLLRLLALVISPLKNNKDLGLQG